MEFIESYRVSSVLNRNNAEFGKKHLFDGNVETCWNSEGKPNQFILLKLKETKQLSQIKIEFQGGFAGKECMIDGMIDGNVIESCPFFPTDSNKLQQFSVKFETACDSYRIVFRNSFDFYGRITIYNFQLEWL